MKDSLAKKTWIGFDLDDTLHEFRRASGAATGSVLQAVSSQYGSDLAELQQAYAKILREKTSAAFADGKTSTDYRRERFTCLLADMSLPHDEAFINGLLTRYEETLTASLQLKAGARELLVVLRDMGKKIVVITEGPRDAQERALQGLGIAPLVDVLATTGEFGASKVDGLFGMVLRKLGVPGGEVAFVGDNYERDVVPARKEGMLAIHFAEGKGEGNSEDGEPVVKTLEELRGLFVDVSTN